MDKEDRHLFTVQPGDDVSRLDRFAAEKLKEHGLSREKIKALIKAGKVWVNDLPAASPKQPLMAGDQILVVCPERRSSLKPEQGGIVFLYRDERLAVVDKPAGLTVHPAPGRPEGTLAHRLVAHFPELAKLEGFRPGIVHRLDKDTSGLMLVALDEPCRLALARQFAQREVFKEYLALVHGVPSRMEGVIEAPIGRHPSHKTRMAVTPGGKNAKSAWRVLHADPRGRFSLVAVRIFSGRTHQVRVHMQHLGHPLLGDKLYGCTQDKSTVQVAAIPRRQMLHAWRLDFHHPFPEAVNAGALEPEQHGQDGELCFVCRPPQDFIDCVNVCSRSMLRVVITGSPGCGKSTLAKLLHGAGLPVFSADAEVADQYRPGGDGQQLLRRWFGDRFVPDEKSPVDKAALGKAMREDPALRRQVESLLHPLVWHALETFWEKEEKAGRTVALAEIPLYLESGTGRDRDLPASLIPLLVGVHCPRQIREERLEQNRGWPREVIAAMESWQWPEEKKMKACDIVVDNTGGLEELERAATRLLKQLETTMLSRERFSSEHIAGLWSGSVDGQ